MHLVIVRLDVVEIDVVAETRRLIEITQVAIKRGHLGNLVSVAFEMVVIDRVEANERGPQANVGLGNSVADQEALVRQSFFEPVKAGEQRVVGLFAVSYTHLTLPTTPYV